MFIHNILAIQLTYYSIDASFAVSSFAIMSRCEQMLLQHLEHLVTLELALNMKHFLSRFFASLDTLRSNYPILFQFYLLIYFRLRFFDWVHHLGKKNFYIFWFDLEKGYFWFETKFQTHLLLVLVLYSYICSSVACHRGSHALDYCKFCWTFFFCSFFPFPLDWMCQLIPHGYL